MKNTHLHLIGMVCFIFLGAIALLGLRYNLNKSKTLKTLSNNEVKYENNNNQNESKNNDNPLTETPSEDYPLYNEITLEQYIQAFKNGERMILYTGRPSCGACTMFTTNLNQVLEDYPNLKIYYIYSSGIDFNGSVHAEFKTLDPAFEKGYTSVPWFILADEGKVVDNNIGSLTKERIIEFLEDNQFLN